MIFLEKIDKLKNSFAMTDCNFQENVTLYGISQPQKTVAEHIIFSPMPEDVIRDLIESYIGIIPQSLITIYRQMNGANLFYKNISIKNVSFPYCFFAIFGVPIESPRVRYEPLDISIEDSESPEGTPQNWLKFAGYCSFDGVRAKYVLYDLFVETDTERVFSQIHHDLQCTIVKSWDSIDKCLCDIFDSLSQVSDK